MATGPLKIAAILQLENDHGQGILRGIGQFAREHAALHVVKFAKADPLSSTFLHRLGVRGVIAKVNDPREELLLARLRLPAVNISGELATPKVSTVNTDDPLLGRLSAQYFHRRGYRHVAYCGNETHCASVLRREGLADECKRLGLICHTHVLPREREISLQPGRTRRALATWLRRLPLPIGLLGFNDLVANEVVASCEVAGLRVPEDVAVMGVGNDLTRLGFSAMPISSIELDTRLIGYRAAEILFNQLTMRVTPPAEELIRPLKIVTRQSTDRFAVQDEAVARALEYIRDHIGNTLYVGEIARAAACSPRTLALKFQRVLAASIYSEVQRFRLERAEELLANPDLSLGEIAFATGHEDARHLNIAFKRHFGIPPGQHRRKQ